MISGSCECPSDTILVDGACELCADANAFPNAGQTKCVCADNYSETSAGTCLKCPSNGAITPDDTCVCKLGYVSDGNGGCMVEPIIT